MTTEEINELLDSVDLDKIEKLIGEEKNLSPELIRNIGRLILAYRKTRDELINLYYNSMEEWD